MIKEQIKSAAEQMQRVIIDIDVEEREHIRRYVTNKFTEGETHWLWEHMKEEASVHDSNAWRWIENFVGDSDVILFFNSGDERAMFRIKGVDLIPILSECSMFEFYITNVRYDYLIAFNHHDILLASGTAKTWLQKYLDK